MIPGVLARRAALVARLGAAMLLGLLAACAPVHSVRRVETTPQAEAAQVAREDALAARTHWALQAHIGVSTSRDSGSGDLEWREDGDAYAFTVHAPITGKTWKLAGDAQGAELDGVENTPLRDTDVERLLRDHVGWDVPLASLRAWTFGLRAPGSTATLTFDDRLLPLTLTQDGWQVEYREWYAAGSVAGVDVAMPKRVFASRGSTKIKLAVYEWAVAP